MTKKYLLLVIICLLSPLSGHAQLSTTEKQELLLKIDHALSNVKTVVYKIDYKDKSFSQRDTMRSIAV